MAKRDFYDVLGVPRGATADQIKKAYRQLARKYHPDTAGADPAAAESFKEVQEAYESLSDPQKRQDYDRFGHAASHMGGGPGPGGPGRTYTWRSGGGGAGGFDFSEIFGGGGGRIEDLFGGAVGGRGRRQAARRGADIEHSVRVSFAEAVSGTTREVVLTMPQADGSQRRERLSVKLPAGVDNGSKIRLRGKGQPGQGGPNGDLIIVITVEAHKYFRRDGDDVLLDVPISIGEAALGAKVDVPTLDDGTTTVTIPPGSSSGQKLRLKGKGVKSRKIGKTGDMLLVLKVMVPKKLDAKSRELLLEFSKNNPQADIRGAWPGVSEKASDT